MNKMSSKRQRRRPQPRVRLPLWAAGLLLFLLAALILGSSVWLFRTVQGMAASWAATNSEFDPSMEDEAPETGGNAHDPLVTSATRAVNEESVLSPEALQPWSGRERVTILLLGIDLRCDEEGPTHTDSMMIITIDPVTHSAAAISLPRDLWVEIPGFGVDRINQAFFKGEIYDYPGGGAALAMETVEATLGVPVDYYAAVNFQAFVDFVDLIGEITVEVDEEINDPDYPDSCYGFDPFHIEAGEHDLDGAQALKFARTRATLGGDVDRAARQQQVVMAVREKVVSLNMAPRLLVQAPQLWQSFQDNVRTNMALDEAVQLALLAQDIPRDQIRLAVIDYEYVYNETTPDGQQVLVANREEIRALRDQLFAPPPIPTPVIEDLPQLMRQEQASVGIHNGTPRFGLAGDTEAYLTRFGIRVAEIGNADSATYASTQILDYGSHPNTTLYLAQLMDIPPLNISYSSKPAGDYDVLVILGNEWQVPGSDDDREE